MTPLRFRWEWESALGVKSPELAATWARLSIELDETPVTLVERRDGSGGLRTSLDVPTYPLAEFLAVNWWRLETTSHLPTDAGVRLVEAGNGFAWPDLTLRSDRGLMWATLRHRDKAPQHVRFLTQGEAVLETGQALSAVADLIDDTVRRLTDQGVTGTLLQDEWQAIHQADAEERDYCRVAAAWGHDPYDTPVEVEELLIDAGSRVGSAALVADLARAVPLEQIGDSTGWLVEAARALDPRVVELPPVGSLDWTSALGVAPWRIGYERARRLRSLLDWDPQRRAPIEDLLVARQTESTAPLNIDGLIREEGTSSLAVVVGANTSPKARRFASASAIGRHSLSPVSGISLLTKSSRYTDRTERAFAAELLAPADGLAEILNGDFSEEAIQRAADRFDVNWLLVQHQVDNQLAA